MRVFLLRIVAVLLLGVSPALAQDVVPDATPEVIDGSTPAPPVVVTVPNDNSDLYFLIGLLVTVGISGYVAVRAISQGGDVFGAFATFLEANTVGNEDLTARLQREYLNADPQRRALIEFLLTAADTVSRLTPDERDDFIRQWTESIRKFEAAAAVKRAASDQSTGGGLSLG